MILGQHCSSRGSMRHSLSCHAATRDRCVPLPSCPSACRAMQKPSRFPLALLLGFGTMLLGYSAIAAAGYW